MIRSIAVAALFVSLAMASAVCAQDELVGTWELVIDPEEEVEGRESLTLEADHTFRIVVEAEFGPEFLNGGFGGDGDVGSFDIEDEELPDIPLLSGRVQSDRRHPRYLGGRGRGTDASLRRN